MGTRGSKFAVALLLALFASAPSALDVPHNESNNINCFNCHDMYSPFAKLLRNENPHTPVNIDDTVANNLCWSCHNDVIAPYKQTHSSLTTHGAYEVSEKHAMTKLTAGGAYADGNFANGERYAITLPVAKLGGGYVDYRFYAFDGRNVSTDAPTLSSKVYVEP